MRVMAGVAALILSFVFWTAIDSFGSKHELFEMFDARSLAGYVAWSSAVISTNLIHFAVKGHRKP